MNTAKQILAKASMRPVKLIDHPNLNIRPVDAVEAMLMFADQHRIAALQSVFEFLKTKGIDIDGIDNIYPKNNIQ